MARNKWILLLPENLDRDNVESYCRSCREESSQMNKPSTKAMDCWKIIVELDASYKDQLISYLEKMIREYGDCWIEYRIAGDRLISLITCRNWRVMWSFREKLIDYLLELGAIDKPYLPYRRAGRYYDMEYGPWRLWARDYYPDRLPLTSIVHARSICPFDGAIMEFIDKGLKCELCGLLVPETLMYEALENGVAEYVLKQGIYRNTVFILRYVGSDRFIVEPKKI